MIQNRFAELDVPVAAAAAAAGIPEPELQQILNGRTAPSADQFLEIMATWGIEVRPVPTPRWQRLHRALALAHNAAALEMQPARTSPTAATLARYAVTNEPSGRTSAQSTRDRMAADDWGPTGHQPRLLNGVKTTSMELTEDRCTLMRTLGEQIGEDQRLLLDRLRATRDPHRE